MSNGGQSFDSRWHVLWKMCWPGYWLSLTWWSTQSQPCHDGTGYCTFLNTIGLWHPGDLSHAPLGTCSCHQGDGNRIDTVTYHVYSPLVVTSLLGHYNPIQPPSPSSQCSCTL